MRCALALAVICLLAPASASAKTVTVTNVVSPSGRISCYAVAHGQTAISCSADHLAEIGELDSYYGLRPRGRAVYDERGDYGGFTGASARKPTTLAYGDVWKRRGTRCVMRTSGLRCENRDGHGFVLAKGANRRF